MGWLSTRPMSVRSCLATALAGSLAPQAGRERGLASENTARRPHSSLENPLRRGLAPTRLNFEWPNRRISAAESNPELPQPTCSGGAGSLSHGCGSPAVSCAAPSSPKETARLRLSQPSARPAAWW